MTEIVLTTRILTIEESMDWLVTRCRGISTYIHVTETARIYDESQKGITVITQQICINKAHIVEFYKKEE